MLLYTVDWYEWEKNRCFLDICLIFRVLSICHILTDFKSASSAEHYIHDAHVADDSDYPLPYRAACAEADDE